MKVTTLVLTGFVLGLQSVTLWAQSAQSVPVVDLNSATGRSAAAAAAKPLALPVASPVVAARGPEVSNTAELLMLVEQLQQEVQNLRGLVEEQAHQLKKMQLNQLDRYRDLDRRLSNLARQPSAGHGERSEPSNQLITETTPSLAPEPSEKKTMISAPRVSDQDAYQRAFTLVRERAYAESLTAFSDFVKVYPTSSLVPNAIFWSAEVYRAQAEFEHARDTYKQLIDQYPSHQKTADAHYKLGVTYGLMGDLVQARAVMENVIRLYPSQSSAKLAADYLKKNAGSK